MQVVCEKGFFGKFGDVLCRLCVVGHVCDHFIIFFSTTNFELTAEVQVVERPSNPCCEGHKHHHLQLQQFAFRLKVKHQSEWMGVFASAFSVRRSVSYIFYIEIVLDIYGSVSRVPTPPHGMVPPPRGGGGGVGAASGGSCYTPSPSTSTTLLLRLNQNNPTPQGGGGNYYYQ